MFTYRQSTGDLSHNGKLIGVAYAGHGEGLNNPAMQFVHGIGPLPVGRYKIMAPKSPPDHLGVLAMALIPQPGTETQGRGDFYLHGDNPLMNHTGSDGCIVAGHVIRVAVDFIRATGDDILEVIA